MTSLTAFSTTELPVGDRVAQWERHNAEQLIGLRCTTIDGQDLTASEITRALPTVQVGRVHGSAHVVERSSASVTAHPADAVVFYLALRGSGFFHHSGGSIVVDPGNLIVCDADRPFLRGFSEGLTEFVVRVPRAVVSDRIASAVSDTPAVIAFGPGPDADLRASALARVVAHSLLTDDSDPMADDAVLVDLVASILENTGGSDTASWAEIEVFVARNAHDPLLSAGDIATAVGISTRQVSRLFAAHEITMSEHVLRLRLDRAYRILSSAGGARSSVAEIAVECGFGSPSYFSRTFKAAYGATPKSVRREVR